MLIQEVSEFAPQKLRELELIFRKLKQNSNNKQARLKLVQQLKDFTKVPEVVFIFNEDINAGIITIYKTATFHNIIKSFTGLFNPNQTVLAPNKLKNMTSVEETAAYIQTIYIYIGKQLLRFLTEKSVIYFVLIRSRSLRRKKRG